MVKQIILLMILAINLLYGTEQDYKQACEQDNAEACYKYGFLYTTNYFVPDNPYLQKACRLKNKEACGTIATIYMSNKNWEKGFEYTKLSCVYGDSRSCIMLSDSYLNSKFGTHKIKYSEHNARVYEEEGERILLEECQNGDPSKCNDLGDLYISKKEFPRTHKPNISYAIKLYRKGCDNGNKDSCRRLIHLYDDKFISIDYADLLRLYEKSCDLYGIYMGHNCEKAGKMYYSQKNYSKAMHSLAKICRVGEPLLKIDSCYLVGSMYLNGEGVERDIGKAKQYFGISCENGKRFQKIISEGLFHGCRAYQKLERR